MRGDFASEVERLRAAGVPGASGRLRDLFDYLAQRGPDADPATQEDIARDVFGQDAPDADDATARVYVHRLRKKIEAHYAVHPDGPMLELPAGTYALRMAGEVNGTEEGHKGVEPRKPGRMIYLGAIGLALLLAGLVIGWQLSGRGAAPNAIWQPLAASDRPVLLVLGDYYLFGEIDPVRPEDGRLIRDFRVDSAEDLAALQEADPETFGDAEDVGLNYLPFQTAYALDAVAPLLARAGERLTVIPASELTAQMLTDHDVVYLGLLSGMGLLEQLTFASSSVRIGDSYDEIVDFQTGQRWVSDEARALASPAFYRDHAYIARFTAPGGALVTVVASERVTGLRGIGPVVAAADLPGELDEAAHGRAFEALFLVAGQQGADLSERLIFARQRD